MFNLKSAPTRGFGVLENFLATRRTQMAERLIPRQLRLGRILDIGCGTPLNFLASVRFGEKYGLDSLAQIVDSDAGENIILKQFDIATGESLPFADNFFEVVVMLAVAEHLEPFQLDNILRETKRVLKKRGRFILTTPCPWSGGLLRIMAKLKLVSVIEIDDHKKGYNQKEIIERLQRAGFETKKIKTGYFEFFLNNWAYADK